MDIHFFFWNKLNKLPIFFLLKVDIHVDGCNVNLVNLVNIYIIILLLNDITINNYIKNKVENVKNVK